MNTRLIRTASGLEFDAFVEGPQEGELVVLLHGFPQSRHAWTSQLQALAAAGYRAIAPDQRGYSPRARPDPAVLANYKIERLVDDVFEIADAAGSADRRFHLVGIDWGGQVAWASAAARPSRLASLSVLSRPHPNAFVRAFDSDPDQQRRSAHHKGYLDPDMARSMLADEQWRVRDLLTRGRVPPARIDEYLSVLGEPEPMEASLAWYRATGLRIDLPDIEVPTLYAWGDQDSSVGRAAAEGTAQHVAASYRFEVMTGIGHFSSDQAPALVNELLLSHIRAHGAWHMTGFLAI